LEQAKVDERIPENRRISQTAMAEYLNIGFPSCSKKIACLLTPDATRVLPLQQQYIIRDLKLLHSTPKDRLTSGCSQFSVKESTSHVTKQFKLPRENNFEEAKYVKTAGSKNSFSAGVVVSNQKVTTWKNET
jgi:hypothetical protein